MSHFEVGDIAIDDKYINYEPKVEILHTTEEGIVFFKYLDDSVERDFGYSSFSDLKSIESKFSLGDKVKCYDSEGEIVWVSPYRFEDVDTEKNEYHYLVDFGDEFGLVGEGWLYEE